MEYLLFLPARSSPHSDLPLTLVLQVRGEIPCTPMRKGTWLRGILTGNGVPIGFGHAALRYTIPSAEADEAWRIVEGMPPGLERNAAAEEALKITKQRVLNIIDDKEICAMFECPEDYMLGYQGAYGIHSRPVASIRPAARWLAAL